MTDQPPKPPSPSGTPPQDFTYDRTRQPCWVCGKRAFWGARFGWLCGEHAQAANDSVAADEPESASPDASMPVVINSRVDVGEPPKADHPAPWRWEERVHCLEETTWLLLDANGNELIHPIGDDWAFVEVQSPGVRALTAAAPQLRSGVVALLGIINQVFHDNWPARGLFPEDAGPICANLRMLLNRIDAASK